MIYLAWVGIIGLISLVLVMIFKFHIRRKPQIKIIWLLPDESIHETTVQSIDEILPLLHSVQKISIHNLSYRYTESELMIDEDGFSLAVSLK
ncbi:hypothetical protein [Paenibacillus elgii]|uniref:hypothetical protein n=1 Tax=Paenibacillus elgii TaxID=189691 RepID=UPI0020417BF4|nr:hypothetical protein [Paenibacillus elgii]MCM3267853.1 hypothetical protein [Paenibacillus elgii]